MQFIIIAGWQHGAALGCVERPPSSQLSNMIDSQHTMTVLKTSSCAGNQAYTTINVCSPIESFKSLAGPCVWTLGPFCTWYLGSPPYAPQKTFKSSSKSLKTPCKLRSSSWTVTEKRDGSGITVKLRLKTKCIVNTQWHFWKSSYSITDFQKCHCELKISRVQ